MPPSHRPKTKAQTRDDCSERERAALLAAALASDSEDSDEEFDEQLNFLVIAAIARHQRWASRDLKEGERGPYDAVKVDEFFERLIHKFTERKFRSWCRMGRPAFYHVLGLIEDDPIFQSTGRRPQRPVAHQLAAYLIRMGGESAEKTSDVTAIAEGTSYLYTSRVSKALRRLKSRFIVWPDEARRAEHKEEMADEGFPGSLGEGDGSLFPLANKPFKSGESYYGRKKSYCIAVQLVVDKHGIILDYELGWPGSVTDSTIFKEANIWMHRGAFFDESEYILVDKGYPLSQYTIRPFGDHDLTDDPEEAESRKRFNVLLSSSRQAVEHAFGRLKGRFPILRCLPGYKMGTIYKTVESVLVLHNILEQFGDSPDAIPGFNGDEDEVVREALARLRALDETGDNLNKNTLYLSGVLRRKVLLAEMKRTGMI